MRRATGSWKQGWLRCENGDIRRFLGNFRRLTGISDRPAASSNGLPESSGVASVGITLVRHLPTPFRTSSGSNPPAPPWRRSLDFVRVRKLGLQGLASEKAIRSQGYSRPGGLPFARGALSL